MPALPNLLAEIGQYFVSLGLPHVCLAAPIVVHRSVVRPNIDLNRLPDCPVVLIEVKFVQDGRQVSGFVEGQLFIVVNRVRNEIERIMPLAPYLEVFPVGTPIWPSELPEGDPYFSAIYYLETRLRNPTVSREDLLQAIQSTPPQTIQQYRQQLLSFIPRQGPPTQRGIILCSGRNDMSTLNLPPGFTWTTIDSSPRSRPDVVGSYDSFELLRGLGLFRWDYVYVGRCPVGLSDVDFQNVLRAARWLVKPGGHANISNVFRQHFEPEREVDRVRREEFFPGNARIDGRRLIFTA